VQGKLIAGINSRVQLLKWTQSEDGSRELTNECSHVGHVLALYIVTRGDFVIVGAPSPTLSLSKLSRSCGIALLHRRPISPAASFVLYDYRIGALLWAEYFV